LPTSTCMTCKRISTPWRIATTTSCRGGPSNLMF
jgi:hypothetical protein